MLTAQQLELVKKIEDTTGPDDLLHPVEREWLQHFKRRFGDEELDPCTTSLKMLDMLYQKALDPDWDPNGNRLGKNSHQ
jgi:hypothetical protein